MDNKLTQNGIIIVDKPEGISSAHVVARLKRISGAKKVGHTGTLDPFATGLMVCGINGGTRISRFFLSGCKAYEATIKLGVDTDTQDCTGETVSTCDPELLSAITPELVERTVAGFKGAQSQLPPVYSALKHNGVPLYKLARSGNPVQKPPRDIEIYDIGITHMELPLVKIFVSCSAGTYIRTLAKDIGEKLGVGGHLTTLRRVETCGFMIHEATTLSELEALQEEGKLESKLVPTNEALKDLPEIYADEKLEARVAHGRDITQADLITEFLDNPGGFVKIINRKNQLIAVIEHQKEKDKYVYCCVFHN